MISRTSGVGRVGGGNDIGGAAVVVVVEVVGGADDVDVDVDAADSMAARQAVSIEPKPTEPASSTSMRRRDRSMRSRYREWPHVGLDSPAIGLPLGLCSPPMVVSTTLPSSPVGNAALWW